MWNGYSAREASEFVGLPESAIRGCVRAGFLAPDDGGVPMRLSFRDLRVLTAVKQLVTAGIPLRRVRRQLTELRSRLPREASLAELSISAWDGNVVVRDQRCTWRADSGQLVFEFATGPVAASPEPSPAGELHAMPVRREVAGPEPAASMTPEQWFDRAVELEEIDGELAAQAYQHALRLRPDCTESWINLGRLYAENGKSLPAAECFREALRLDPADATALYNLGVVAQDTGADDDAIKLYLRALAVEPQLAEAHYNLATLYDRTGDTRSAIRHINAYRKLTRES